MAGAAGRLARALRVLALVALGASAAFGPGFQAVSALAVANLGGAMAFALTAPAWPELLALLAAEVAGQWVAYMFVFGRAVKPAASLAASLLLITTGLTLLGLAIVPPLRRLPRRFRLFALDRAGALLLPVSFTAFFSAWTVLSPVGSWSNFAYAFVDVRPLAQLTALFGLDGINFVVSWGVSLALAVWLGPILAPLDDASAQRDLSGNYRALPDTTLAEVEARAMAARRRRRRFARHFNCYGLTLVLLLTAGGLASLGGFGRFFQRNIEDWNMRHANAVCMTGYGDAIALDDWLNRTRDMLSRELFLGQDLRFQRADILLWSEVSVSVHSEAEEAALFAQVGAIANATGALVGFGYSTPVTGNAAGKTVANMFALVLPDGSVGIKYQKVHPVPFVETSVEPGILPVEPIPTPLGTIGAAICFDFDFPNFVRSAAERASLMLQPGEDWGPIGILHARMDAMRAVENGFTLFRCSSGGVSGVYGPYGDIVLEAVLGTDKLNYDDLMLGYTAQIPIMPRVFTLYSLIGGALGYLCVMAWLALMVIMGLPDSLVLEHDTLARVLEPVRTAI